VVSGGGEWETEVGRGPGPVLAPPRLQQHPLHNGQLIGELSFLLSHDPLFFSYKFHVYINRTIC
jgi:hypothetical protein